LYHSKLFTGFERRFLAKVFGLLIPGIYMARGGGFEKGLAAIPVKRNMQGTATDWMLCALRSWRLGSKGHKCVPATLYCTWWQFATGAIPVPVDVDAHTAN